MDKRYSSDLAQQRYDAIIIGSGLGGITTAALLAQSGKKVLVLERHYVPGGFTHSFARKKYEWDVGVHYVGKVDDESSVMRKAFDVISEGKLKWTKMDVVYDQIIIADKKYKFVEGEENQITQLIEYFPLEERAIRAYYKKVKELSAQTTNFFAEKAMPPFLSRWIGNLLRKKFNSFSDRSTSEVLEGITDNKDLAALLCAQCGNYGLPPQKSSFAIHAIITDHYLDGGNYPVGGAKEIFNTIAEVIRKHGGEIVVEAEVKKIILKAGVAVGVEMVNGDSVFAKKIISNAGARNTFLNLIPGGNPLFDSIRSDLESVKPSSSHICMYIGMNASDKHLNLPKSNYWIYKNSDFDAEFKKHMADSDIDPSLYYISFPSARDGGWDAAHPDRSTIQVIVACSYLWMEKWNETKWMKRGADYLKFKEDFKKKLLAKLFEVVPQVEEYIDVCEISTPLSTQHFSNYSEGEIYGLEHTPQRFRLKWLRAQSPIKNLYLTGQDTLVVGLGGAIFSGVITASVILKRNIFRRIEKYRA